MDSLERVPVGPFSDWLKEEVAKHGYSEVARRSGMDDSRIGRYIKQREYSQGKMRPIRNVSIYTIDKVLVSMDSNRNLWEFE